MQISFSWLKELVDFDFDLKTLAEKLTQAGVVCESVAPMAPSLDELVVVGKVVSCENHPATSELKLCKVDYGKETPLEVVCGAPNTRIGIKAPLALEGARLPNGINIGRQEKQGVVSYGMLCSEVELSLSDDHSGLMELEPELKIGTPVAQALCLNDYTLSFELTPNRPDCLSAIGLAREISALSGRPMKRPAFEIEEISEKAGDCVAVTLDDPEGCPRYAARVIKDVRIGPSPWWLRRRLLASGMRSINNVVDVTNFVMLEYGHPLHAFDFDNFSRPEIVVRRAQDGEKFTTLDDVERTLNREVLLITDGVKAVAIAGIMGGQESEVCPKTTKILLESAYFDPKVIRRGRKHLGLTSESQTRFERGADPNIVSVALDRAASLIAKLASGKLLSGAVDNYPRKITPVQLELRPARVNKILATELSNPQMIDILRSLEFKVTPGKNLTVEVPTFRPDITREIDLIEEIGRVYGYEKIPVRVKAGGNLVTSRVERHLFADELRQALISQGYFEVVTNSIVDPKEVRMVEGDVSCIEILNPISEDLKWLRPSLKTSLLGVVRNNINQRVTSVKIFEIGTRYRQGDGPLADEEQSVALALSGSDCGENWAFHPEPFGFPDLKGGLELIESLIDSKITYKAASGGFFDQDCSFQLGLDSREVGVCGQIVQELLRDFGIKQDVFYAEISFEAFFRERKIAKYYQPLPRFPSSERDIAVVVDERVLVSDLLSCIRESADQTLKEAVVFDLYRGKQVERGQKSLAFRLVFRDESKTLIDADIDSVYNRIVDSLAMHYGARLRT